MNLPGGAEPHYLDCAARAAGGGARAAGRRRLVSAFFRGGGFPTASDEDWRFSGLDLTTVLYRPFGPGPGGDADPRRAIGEIPGWVGSFGRGVCLVDGRLTALPAGAGAGGSAPEIRGFGSAETAEGPEDGGGADSEDDRGRFEAAGLDWPGEQPLETLNAALFDCGALVRAPAEADCPPALLYSLRTGNSVGNSGADSGAGSANGADAGEAAPRMLHPRFRTVVGSGSRATVVEVHDGATAADGREAAGWTNPTSLCRVGENAELHYLRLDLEPGNIAHTGRVTFELDRDSRVRCSLFSLGTGRSRTEVRALLRGEGAEADLNGLFLGVGAGKADHHTLVVHAARHTASRQLFKSVLAEESSSVFDGKVVVTPGAAGTDASQANRTLLLSRRAETHTRPRLEINADEVKCAHGAAIGKLDEDALFYLRSRGLGAMDSREILIRAFAAEVIERAGVETIRELAEARLRAIRPHWSRERSRPA